MGLFDKIKSSVKNTAQGMKDAYEEADKMDIYELCEVYKEIGKLDPKALAYRTCLAQKCNGMRDDDLEEVYINLKKAGKLLKQHPAKEVVEDELVQRQMYIRDEDGIVTKNNMYKLFK